MSAPSVSYLDISPVGPGERTDPLPNHWGWPSTEYRVPSTSSRETARALSSPGRLRLLRTYVAGGRSLCGCVGLCLRFLRVDLLADLVHVESFDLGDQVFESFAWEGAWL